MYQDEHKALIEKTQYLMEQSTENTNIVEEILPQ